MKQELDFTKNYRREKGVEWDVKSKNAYL